MFYETIYGKVIITLLVIIVVCYVIDIFCEPKDTRKRVSKYNETFINYVGSLIKLIIPCFLGWLFTAATITAIFNLSDDVCKNIATIILLVIYLIFLPLSRRGYIAWLDEADEREAKRANNRKREMFAEEIIKQKDDYLSNKLNELDFKFDKKFRISDSTTIAFDTENKQWFTYTFFINKKMEPLEKYLKDKTDEEISKLTLESLLSTYYKYTQSPIYKFSDIIRVEVVDKTVVDTKRSYTIEGKTGSSIIGAILGDALLGGVSAATVGAIAGASGQREVTEHVETNKTIAFDLVVYLNDINTPYKTFRVTNEYNLRELVGIFEYIMNNRE